MNVWNQDSGFLRGNTDHISKNSQKKCNSKFTSLQCTVCVTKCTVRTYFVRKVLTRLAYVRIAMMKHK